ncbi:PEPxxWA-CTERM sorting domain-containing protein [Phenylobacterium sp.]|uniref:PEPxxWA-CTERM sorting domain-containing protein n=1 Tax=Phenylobacterium sp. TaxID=1871053 RepID=UPI0025DD9D7C|nr:PEPxxWA-CTERM sorting domain-containing protein [Phenylobacterium sp.]
MKLAAAAISIVLTAGAAQAAAPLYGFQLSGSSEALSPAELASFLGAPDDLYTGIGSGFITYDFGDYRLVDGAGQDLNVYEVDGGSVEFSSVDILVSNDGVTFFNIEASSAAAVDLVGDEAHGSASFRRSYDLGAAVTALGVSQFRYLRLDGTSGGSISGSNGFDPDAVAAINYIDTRQPVTGVPEPATWAMMILGFGAAGATLRRRRTAVA